MVMLMPMLVDVMTISSLPVQVGPISQLIRQPPANSPTKLPTVETPNWHLKKRNYLIQKYQLSWITKIFIKYTSCKILMANMKIDAVKNGQSCPLEEKVFTVPFVLCKLDFFLLLQSFLKTNDTRVLTCGRRKSQIKVSFQCKRWFFARKCCLPGRSRLG